MKIIKKESQWITREIIKANDGEMYYRTLYCNADAIWTPLSYDGECDNEKLEKEYHQEYNRGTIG